MNLNQQHSLDDLAKLFASCRDKYDSHILWINEAGEVRLDCLPPEVGETEFEQRTPGLRTRLRTYRRGSGYVGKKAAADREFLGRVYHTLQTEWRASREASGVRYVDRYC